MAFYPDTPRTAVEWGGHTAGPPSYDTRGVNRKREFPLSPNYYVPHGIDYGRALGTPSYPGFSNSWSGYDPYAVADLAYYNNVYGGPNDPLYTGEQAPLESVQVTMAKPTDWIGKTLLKNAPNWMTNVVRYSDLMKFRPVVILPLGAKVPNLPVTRSTVIVWVDLDNVVRAVKWA